MSELEKEYLIFSLNEESEEFVEKEALKQPLFENFDSNSIFIIVDSENKKVWIWHGTNTSMRRKFIATQNAPIIRDKYGIDYKISAIDEGDEPPEFGRIIGLD